MRSTPIAILLALALCALPAAARKSRSRTCRRATAPGSRRRSATSSRRRKKTVFLQLANDREREMFITAFWKARDKDTNTPENEFKDEHYRRIDYANKNFGRGLKAGGWRSDMGRIYITLGEPKTIERYENENDVYPMIIWFYQGLTSEGLPNAFNVVFFKKDNAGDYILYSPIRDGPQKLMPFYHGDMTNPVQAWGELRPAHAGAGGRLDVAHPGRIRLTHVRHPGLRHPDQPEDPQAGLRERQGRLRREAPQIQGHRAR